MGTPVSPVVLRWFWRARASGNGSPVAVLWPDKKFLDEVDSIPEVSAMLVVPHSKKAVQEWIATREAIELTTGKKAPSSSINPVVEEALKDLDAWVNTSTGLVHPSDRETAVQIFKALRRGGIEYDPNEVKRWLIRNGWTPNNAEQVRVVAEKINQGKGRRQGQNKLGRAPWKRWKSQAES